jgi:hypothetical protein
MLIERRQGDVRQQGREHPTLRRAGDRVLEASLLGQDPGPQERLDERQHALVRDALAHPAHQGRVVDAVEARLDVRLEHPLIRAAGEVAHLGDRVLRPAPGPKPVGARLKISLEDRLQHQLEGGLHDRSRTVAIPSRRSFPPRLGITRSFTGAGRKLPPRSSSRSPARNRSTPSRRSTS